MMQSLGHAQEGVKSFGIQFKPIIPSNLFRAGDLSISPDSTFLDYIISQELGYSFGMNIRIGFTDMWNLEMGINYVKRNFTYSMIDNQTGFKASDEFSIIGYEVPVLALLNVQLDKQIFMSTSFGPSFNMFPSHVASGDQVFSQLSLKSSWLQLALQANIGWEYRTKNSGSFYLGGSFHRPFKEIYLTQIKYTAETYTDKTIGRLSGNYLTVDLRYYFQDDESKSKKKR